MLELLNKPVIFDGRTCSNPVFSKTKAPIHRHRPLIPKTLFNTDKAKAMKAVILAGGLGTRISEETETKPKPMVEVGGKPILWHIMKIYSAHGINDFIICCGYKGYV